MPDVFCLEPTAGVPGDDALPPLDIAGLLVLPFVFPRFGDD